MDTVGETHVQVFGAFKNTTRHMPGLNVTLRQITILQTMLFVRCKCDKSENLLIWKFIYIYTRISQDAFITLTAIHVFRTTQDKQQSSLNWLLLFTALLLCLSVSTSCSRLAKTKVTMPCWYDPTSAFHVYRALSQRTLLRWTQSNKQYGLFFPSKTRVSIRERKLPDCWLC